MISRGNEAFWKLYHALPTGTRAQARQTFRLFLQNPDHPGVRFKKLNSAYPLWSVRFGDGYRAVAHREGETITWLWIGTHQAFDKLF